MNIHLCHLTQPPQQVCGVDPLSRTLEEKTEALKQEATCLKFAECVRLEVQGG